MMAEAKEIENEFKEEVVVKPTDVQNPSRGESK